MTTTQRQFEFFDERGPNWWRSPADGLIEGFLEHEALAVTAVVRWPAAGSVPGCASLRATGSGNPPTWDCHVYEQGWPPRAGERLPVRWMTMTEPTEDYLTEAEHARLKGLNAKLVAALADAVNEITEWRNWAGPGNGPVQGQVTSTVLKNARAALGLED